MGVIEHRPAINDVVAGINTLEGPVEQTNELAVVE